MYFDLFVGNEEEHYKSKKFHFNFRARAPKPEFKNMSKGTTDHIHYPFDSLINLIVIMGSVVLRTKK